MAMMQAQEKPSDKTNQVDDFDTKTGSRPQTAQSNRGRGQRGRGRGRG